MLPRLSEKLLVGCLFPVVCSSSAQAQWSGEVYGGRYYDDERLGAYFVASSVIPEGPTLIAEILYEDYLGYEFAGIGGHFLWPVAETVYLGVVASQAWETLEFDGFGDFDYETRLAGLELELTSDRITLAVQSGKYYTDFDDTSSAYLSADLYVWSPQYNWYLRGATRWITNNQLHFIEGYHTRYLLGLPFTGYIGTSVLNSNTLTEATIDSVYAGAYLELFSAPYSTLFLWTEVAEFDGETLWTIELNLFFGPGARTPYISSFGFTIDR